MADGREEGFCEGTQQAPAVAETPGPGASRKRMRDVRVRLGGQFCSQVAVCTGIGRSCGAERGMGCGVCGPGRPHSVHFLSAPFVRTGAGVLHPPRKGKDPKGWHGVAISRASFYDLFENICRRLVVFWRERCVLCDVFFAMVLASFACSGLVGLLLACSGSSALPFGANSHRPSIQHPLETLSVASTMFPSVIFALSQGGPAGWRDLPCPAHDAPVKAAGCHCQAAHMSATQME